MIEPLVIQKMKELASLTSYVDLAFQDNEHGKYFYIYDQGIEKISLGPSSSHPNTYKELLENLDDRIEEIKVLSVLRAANDS